MYNYYAERCDEIRTLEDINKIQKEIEDAEKNFKGK